MRPVPFSDADFLIGYAAALTYWDRWWDQAWATKPNALAKSELRVSYQAASKCGVLGVIDARGTTVLPKGRKQLRDRIERALALHHDRLMSRAVPPTAPVQVRLFDQIARTIYAVWAQSHRGEDSEVHVRLDDPVDCSVRRDAIDGHPVYVTAVSKKWLSRVQREGIVVVDGRLVLDAKRLGDVPYTDGVYDAIWVEPGRGYDVYPLRGVIVRVGDDVERLTHRDLPSRLCSLDIDLPAPFAESALRRAARVARRLAFQAHREERV